MVAQKRAKKPSLTKQIAEALGTEDKREQLQSIEQLKQVAQVAPVAVSVLYTAAGVEVAVVSPVQVNAEQVKIILNKGVDQITAAIVRSQMEQQEAEEALPEPIEPA